MNNEKAKNAKWGDVKLRIQNHRVRKYSWNWFGRFMKLLEVKVHYYEIEVWCMSNRVRRILNQFRRFMQLVEHFDNIGWKVHKLVWNLHEIEFALPWSRLQKEYLNFKCKFRNVDSHTWNFLLSKNTYIIICTWNTFTWELEFLN